MATGESALIELAPTTYGQVAEHMLFQQPNTPSAFLKGDQLGNLHEKGIDFGSDFSFSRQIREAEQSGVDTFALTAYSAVPVADAIRGYYHGRRAQEPIITYIHTPNKWYYAMLAKAGKRYRLAQDDIGDLEAHTADSANICIVEQYIHSGFSLQIAAQALRAVGHTSLSGICGLWYDSVDQREAIDISAMTSSHSAFMQRVGKAASL